MADVRVSPPGPAVFPAGSPDGRQMALGRDFSSRPARGKRAVRFGDRTWCRSRAAAAVRCGALGQTQSKRRSATP